MLALIALIGALMLPDNQPNMLSALYLSIGIQFSALGSLWLYRRLKLGSDSSRAGAAIHLASAAAILIAE